MESANLITIAHQRRLVAVHDSSAPWTLNALPVSRIRSQNADMNIRTITV